MTASLPTRRARSEACDGSNGTAPILGLCSRDRTRSSPNGRTWRTIRSRTGVSAVSCRSPGGLLSATGYTKYYFGAESGKMCRYWKLICTCVQRSYKGLTSIQAYL
ncbi:hypothetical protein ZEAMMB73_Zm00001d020391 [Zea mays]|uniref:Uncharacterized protein n=1 Tax=Zea mays TaxID=4577 RepID=A0A1D6I3X7_MAIZE|nr:hypothetical protein ZEAMMB73_Zm00001d020391 [Zea mays]